MGYHASDDRAGGDNETAPRAPGRQVASRDDEDRRVAVIGAGPAGIAAAVQLSRSGLRPTVFEREAAGGLLREARLIENYPGFPNGISGADLAELMARQLGSSGVSVLREEVLSLERERVAGPRDGLLVETATRKMSVPRAIVASGTVPVEVDGIAIEDAVSERVVRGVGPLREVNRSRVVVVGGGDAAFDYALGLAQRNTVTVVMRSDRSRCIPVLRRSAEESPNIELLTNTSVLSLESDSEGSVVAVCESSGVRSRVECDYAVLALGRVPAVGFVAPDLLAARSELGERGVLLFAGDVATGACRQTAIAVGEGVMCAMRTACCVSGEEADGRFHRPLCPSGVPDSDWERT